MTGHDGAAGTATRAWARPGAGGPRSRSHEADDQQRKTWSRASRQPLGCSPGRMRPVRAIGGLSADRTGSARRAAGTAWAAGSETPGGVSRAAWWGRSESCGRSETSPWSGDLSGWISCAEVPACPEVKVPESDMTASGAAVAALAGERSGPRTLKAYRNTRIATGTPSAQALLKLPATSVPRPEEGSCLRATSRHPQWFPQGDVLGHRRSGTLLSADHPLRIVR